MKLHFYWNFFILAFSILSCDREPSDAKKNSSDHFESNQKYRILNGSDLNVADSLIKGNGALVAKKPLLGIESSIHTHIDFTVKNDSRIELVFYADKDLNQGISIVFTKENSDSLILSINQSSEIKIPLSTLKKDIVNSENYTLDIDIHNHEKPPHILIWSGNLDTFTEDNTIFDSSLSNLNLKNGKGFFWGMILKNAELRHPSMEGAKFEH